MRWMCREWSKFGAGAWERSACARRFDRFTGCGGKIGKCHAGSGYRSMRSDQYSSTIIPQENGNKNSMERARLGGVDEVG